MVRPSAIGSIGRVNRNTTQGLVFNGPGRALAIEELELDPPGEGEVLVRMVASGVCHSDLHVVDGEWERPANVVLGHEGAAIVEALGPDVPADSLREGDLVVLAWTAPCGSCAACLRAEPWLCTQPRGSGHRLRPDDVRLRRKDGTPIGAYSGIGTFGERQVVAASAAIPIEPSTPPEIAALIGCGVTTGFGAVINTAGVRAGDSVVVIGGGGVGLSAVMGARFADAGPIAVIDTNIEKLDLARRAGATHAFQPSEADAVRDLTDGGADHVIEAIGLTDTVEQAIDVVRPGGDRDPGRHDGAGTASRHRCLSVRRGRKAAARLELRLGDPGDRLPAHRISLRRRQPPARPARDGAHRPGRGRRCPGRHAAR